MNEIPPDVTDAFFGHIQPALLSRDKRLTVTPIGKGLINHSYKIWFPPSTDFFLQKINRRVFPNPEDVQANFEQVAAFAENNKQVRIPLAVYCSGQSTLYVDQEAEYWRAFEFIDHYTFDTATTTQQAYATARTFAGFTAAFRDFDTSMLKQVIPDFHNLEWRYIQFELALDSKKLSSEISRLADALLARKQYRDFYNHVTRSGNFIRRVIHHDANIGNVLFDASGDHVICLVDFDTVMPGYFFSDAGDLIRTMSCNCTEGSTELEQIYIRKDFYAAIVNGYLDILGPLFTEAEKKYFHYAGLLMIYMQALRFLTDHLDGDTYYKVDYPGQNFDRARNQLLLLESLEALIRTEYHLPGL